ncbi:hypothetical protein GCM10007103_35410 [Salinimicrobium marinum]|uniref:Signal peptidase I n=2 Tax=Salinimicrobium marinum TaxID=680283 RepID=A0A918SLE3_9FLAO|nr:hypothetical protein GCM10007103_35410 [Salinimicrobium marinum]
MNCSNYPNLVENEVVLFSKWIPKKSNNWIVVNDDERKYQILRLVGFPNDTMTIVNGILYRNNRNLDLDLNLAHYYGLKKIQFEELEYLKDFRICDIAGEGDSVFLNVNDKVGQSLKESKRFIRSKRVIDPIIKETYGKNWNLDHFGPFVVPEGRYFAVGDNREMALDSRYLGPIDEKDFLGSVILTY